LAVPRTIQIVANPAAGSHCMEKVGALASALERAGAEVIRSECGPGRDVAIDARADHLCVVGGDGTVRHAARALDASGRTLAISVYPAGTINLLDRENPCDVDPERFAASLLGGGEARRHYAATLNDSLFLACASVGPDSAAVAAVSPRLKRRLGRIAYGVAFLKLLVTWPRERITLRADGRTIDCEAFYVAKGRFFAGPWSFAPDARLTERRLHVVALAKAGRWRYLRFLLAMVTGGSVARVPGVVCFDCTALEAECARPLPVQADGDIAATLPVSIALREGPLLFL
jgi:diacylglycerol kinase family enzyme